MTDVKPDIADLVEQEIEDRAAEIANETIAEAAEAMRLAALEDRVAGIESKVDEALDILASLAQTTSEDIADLAGELDEVVDEVEDLVEDAIEDIEQDLAAEPDEDDEAGVPNLADQVIEEVEPQAGPSEAEPRRSHGLFRRVGKGR